MCQRNKERPVSLGRKVMSIDIYYLQEISEGLLIGYARGKLYGDFAKTLIRTASSSSCLF